MSDFRLQPGTIMTACLHRADQSMKGLGFAMSVSCQAGCGVTHLGMALITRRHGLLMHVPEILPPGPPLTLLLQFISANCILTGSASSWLVERDTTREEVADMVLGGIGPILSDALENVRQQLSIKHAFDQSNAPTTQVKQ